MSRVTALIVDDEIDGRETLHNFLGKYCKQVDILGTASSVAEAAAFITENNPQLVFLDINMPEGNGFTLFEKVPDAKFHVIFTTAYDEYALQAIKHNAIDYLLKPINIDELVATVERVEQLIETEEGYEQYKARIEVAFKKEKSGKISLPILDGLVYVNLQDIVRCEADGNYTTFYFTDRPKLLVCKTLGYYEKALREYGFIRIHHHHLINMEHVEKYQRGRGGVVYMSDKKQIDVSQRKKDDFLKVLEGL